MILKINKKANIHNVSHKTKATIIYALNDPLI